MSTGRNLNDNEYELLSAYLDGRLTDTERRTLEVRLQADADLRRELAALRRTVQLIRELPTLKAPRSFALTPAMVLSGEPTRPITAVPKPRNRLLIFPTTFAFSALSAAAAMLLFILGAGMLLSNFGMSSAPQNLAYQAIDQTSIAALPSATITHTETLARTASPTAGVEFEAMQQLESTDLGIVDTPAGSASEEVGRVAEPATEIEVPESAPSASILSQPAAPPAPDEGLMDGFVTREDGDNAADAFESETQNFALEAPVDEQSQTSAATGLANGGDAAGEFADDAAGAMLAAPAPAPTNAAPSAANAQPDDTASDALPIPKTEIVEPEAAGNAAPFSGADTELPSDQDAGEAADGSLSLFAQEDEAEEPPTGGMGGGVSAFQPTFVPTLTASNTARPTATKTRRPSATPRPSNTPIPSDTPNATLTIIAQRGISPTEERAVSPMLQPNPREAISDAVDYADSEFNARSDGDNQRNLLFGASLVAISVILLGIAIATTLARRRQRTESQR